MNVRGWLQGAWPHSRRSTDAAAPPAANAGWEWDGLGGVERPWELWRGLTGRNLEMAEVQEEVAAESRGQVLIIGRCDELNRGLLARLRGVPPVPPAGPVYFEGFFTLVSLPPAREAGPGPEEANIWPLSDWQNLAREADLLLYVFDQAAGWRTADAHWCARLRAAGVPLLWVAANAAVHPPESAAFSPGGREDETDATASPCACAEQPRIQPEAGGPAAALPVGCRPVSVALTQNTGQENETPADVIVLVEQMLALRPRLGIPLAQEIPGCRPLVARRAIRAGMMMTALLGAEPIPLLDLPLQVALNWKVALQLAAIFGHAGLDYRSRELLATTAWNLGLRYLIQQVVKLAPVLGWGVSAGLSAGGTWLFGNALLRYYQGNGRLTLGRLPTAGDVLQIANNRWQVIRSKVRFPVQEG